MRVFVCVCVAMHKCPCLYYFSILLLRPHFHHNRKHLVLSHQGFPHEERWEVNNVVMNTTNCRRKRAELSFLKPRELNRERWPVNIDLNSVLGLSLIKKGVRGLWWCKVWYCWPLSWKHPKHTWRVLTHLPCCSCSLLSASIWQDTPSFSLSLSLHLIYTYKPSRSLHLYLPPSMSLYMVYI